MLDIPVLISGGGPVGLTASLLLSRHGVRSLLVERHPGTALTPKARGINARTMEVFRQCGIDAAIRDAGLAEGRLGLIVWTETLAGKEIERRAASAPRWNADPKDVQKSVARLVLALIEFLRKLLEKQAIRRMETGNLTEAEIERLGSALMKLEEKMDELKKVFGLNEDDLNLSLGPIKTLE